jgi:hypothetical protein
MAEEINITAVEGGAAGFTNGRIKITGNGKCERDREKACPVTFA